jgi:hypothetical protein
MTSSVSPSSASHTTKASYLRHAAHHTPTYVSFVVTVLNVADRTRLRTWFQLRAVIEIRTTEVIFGRAEEIRKGFIGREHTLRIRKGLCYSKDGCEKQKDM